MNTVIVIMLGVCILAIAALFAYLYVELKKCSEKYKELEQECKKTRDKITADGNDTRANINKLQKCADGIRDSVGVLCMRVDVLCMSRDKDDNTKIITRTDKAKLAEITACVQVNRYDNYTEHQIKKYMLDDMADSLMGQMHLRKREDIRYGTEEYYGRLFVTGGTDYD